MAGLRVNRFHLLLFFAETLVILFAEAIAFTVRFSISSWSLAAYPHLAAKSLLVVFVIQLCLYYNELYRFGRVLPVHELALRILQSVATATILLLAIYYVIPSLHVGRGSFFPAVLLAFIFLFFWRYALQILSRKGGLSRRTLVVGSGPAAARLYGYFSDPLQVEFEVVGLLEEDSRELGPFRAVGPVLGGYNTLHEVVRRERVDLVVVALEDRRGKLPLAELSRCKLDGVEVVDDTRFFEMETGAISLANVRPSWLIFSEGFRQSKVTVLFKNAGETLLSIALLAALSPLMALIALAIRLDSKGPVLYRQVRVGMRGNAFNLVKFRSMRTDAEADGEARWAQENDPRVTIVGRFLRRYRLDELPQIFNVLKGEMSFIGPRPERPQFVNDLQEKIPCYVQRLAVKPGVTGLAQVRHHYGATEEDAARKLEYDLFYVKNLSIFLDLSILIDTFKVVLLGRGAR